MCCTWRLLFVSSCILNWRKCKHRLPSSDEHYLATGGPSADVQLDLESGRLLLLLLLGLFIIIINNVLIVKDITGAPYKIRKKQEIRSVELGVCPMQLFHFWSRDVHPVQNLLLCRPTKFHRNRMIMRWNMAIYRFSKWRPSAILE